jgi:alpha-amylase
MIDAQYSLGGVPTILVPSDQLSGSGLCGTDLAEIAGNGGKADALNAAFVARPSASVLSLTAVLMAAIAFAA